MEQLYTIIANAGVIVVAFLGIYLGTLINQWLRVRKERKARLKLVTPEHIEAFCGSCDSVDALKDTIAGADKL